jgi:membrane-associated protease RseP (regulator of RpoE activity)
MPLDDADDERPEFSFPLPPDDRLWRHPSELAAEQTTEHLGETRSRPALGASAPATDVARRRRRNLAASGAVLLGTAAVIGLVVFAGSIRDAPSTPTIALRAVETDTTAVTTGPDPSTQASGATIRSWLGVHGTDPDVTVTSAAVVGSPSSSGRGAILLQVDAGSPAERGGLRSGDVVTAVDGQDLDSMAELMHTVQRNAPGTPLSITYRRGGVMQATTVVLAPPPAATPAAKPADPDVSDPQPAASPVP